MSNIHKALTEIIAIKSYSPKVQAYRQKDLRKTIQIFINFLKNKNLNLLQALLSSKDISPYINRNWELNILFTSLYYLEDDFVIETDDVILG
jgi:hypothetical protein